MVKIDNIKLEQFDTEKYEVPDFLYKSRTDICNEIGLYYYL